MNGVILITRERLRQTHEEGFTLDSDRETYCDKPGQLNMAAICYATMAGSSPEVRDLLRDNTPAYWPWDPAWWKPGKDNSHSSRVRELVKAGAMLAAEIDRLIGEINDADASDTSEDEEV